MKMKKGLKASLMIIAIGTFCGCGKKMTFEEQIANDVSTKMGTGICESIPKGSTISNVKVGEIAPIGDTGLIDVSLAFDYENGGEKKHHESAVLYSKQGSRYDLEALGGCDYKRKR